MFIKIDLTEEKFVYVNINHIITINPGINGGSEVTVHSSPQTSSFPSINTPDTIVSRINQRLNNQ